MSVASAPPPFRRPHTPAERAADACVHVLGIAAGIIGAIIIVAITCEDGPGGRIAAIGIYAGALAAMLFCSALYNLAYGTRFRALFRRFDHCAIFLMIAGTYTPFTTQLLELPTAAAMTAGVWAAALGGVGLKLFAPDRFERLSVVMYLLLGWFAIAAVWPMLSALSTLAFIAMLCGGLLYTAGVAFHKWERLPFQNAIWHVFVLAAAVCHYIAVLDGVVLTPALRAGA